MTGLIDIHAHFIPDWYADEARAAGYVESIDGMPGWPAWSPEEHLALMDRHGIQTAMLSLSAPGVHFGDDAAAADLASRTNDYVLDLVGRHPGRFGLLASLPLPAVDAAIAEARRALDAGADGIAVKTNAHGVYLADAALEPLWTELDERGAVVFMHPTAAPGAAETAFGRPSPMLEYLLETTRTVVDLAVSGVFERHPRLRFVAPHLGGVLPVIADRVAMFQTLFGENLPGKRPNRSTVPLTDALKTIWFDLAGTPLPTQARPLIDVAGHEHLVYGSDYCFTPEPLVARQLAELDAGWSTVSDTDWRELTTRNAGALLARAMGDTDDTHEKGEN